MIQDDNSTSNGNRDPPAFDGMADAEVERRLKVVYQDPSHMRILLDFQPNTYDFYVDHLLFAQDFGIINNDLLIYLVVQPM